MLVGRVFVDDTHGWSSRAYDSEFTRYFAPLITQDSCRSTLVPTFATIEPWGMQPGRRGNKNTHPSTGDDTTRGATARSATASEGCDLVTLIEHRSWAPREAWRSMRQLEDAQAVAWTGGLRYRGAHTRKRASVVSEGCYDCSGFLQGCHTWRGRSALQRSSRSWLERLRVASLRPHRTSRSRGWD